MTKKELRKLNRKDLLQMLIDQSQEVEVLQNKLDEAQAALENRTIAIDQAGSIAEAALQLSGIFQASPDASQQYLDNIRQLSQRQEEICARMEEESREKAKNIIEEAERFRVDTERETQAKCAEMLRNAEEQSKAYWDEVSYRLEKFYEEHSALRKLLSISPTAEEGSIEKHEEER